jgi:thiamine-phosphate pyrophosphorylase
MKLIVISPERGTDELELLEQLFQQGLEYFHLRKPAFDEKIFTEYLNAIPQKHHDKIIIHSHHHLADKFELKGIHYPERLRKEMQSYPGSFHLSTSIHRLEDLVTLDSVFQYVFLSPIFNSISKGGYNAAFDFEELRKTVMQNSKKVIALGGVNENNLNRAKEIGFAGVGILGAIWESKDPVGKFKLIKKKLDTIP